MDVPEIEASQRSRVAYERERDAALARSSGGPVNQGEREKLLQRHRQALAERNSAANVSPSDTAGSRKCQHYQLNAHSCDHCSRFVIDVSGPTQHPMVGFVAPKTINMENVTLTDVKDGAERGCHLCQRIDGQFTSKMGISDDQLTCVTHAGRGPGGEFDIASLEHICIWNVDKMWAKWDNTDYGKAWFEVHALQDDPASSFVSSRPINISTVSDETFKLARSWLAECQYGHTACQSYQSTFTPDRLIHVSDGTTGLQLRLVDVDGAHQLDYTALSYCWGGVQKAQTVRADIEDYRSSIDLAWLPQTLKDAIHVTWKLRVSHIWIDSLCIIQDDPEDKAIQIAQMPKIYANSRLTISTSRALFADEGFLHDRIPTHEPDFVFKLPYRLPSSGELGSIILSHPAPELSDSLLLGRAWAFQEYLISPRILDWSGGQLTWVCPGTAQSQGYVDGGSIRGGIRTEHDLRNAVLDMSVPESQRRVQWRSIEAMKFWHHVVVVYTEKELTIESDRALAIAGVAELCQNACSQEYLAGHWMLDWFEEYFVASLLWSMRDRPGPLPRPTDSQGPSWSWTAVNGPIHFWDVEDLLSGRCKPRIKAKAIYCTVDLESQQAPFGAANSGSLVLEGRTRPAKWLRSKPMEEQQRHGQNPDDLVAADGNFIPARMIPDAYEKEWDSPDVSSMDVTLIEVGYGIGINEETVGAKGLVLRDLGDGFPSRLGIFSVDSREVNRRCQHLWKAELDHRNPDQDQDLTNIGELVETGGSMESDIKDDEAKLSASDPNYWADLRQRTEREHDAVQRVWQQHFDVFKDCDRRVLVIV